MTTLRWERKSAGRWLLKAADGQIWAAVVPYTGNRRTTFKATALGENRNRYSIEKYGSPYWMLMGSIQRAKRGIVDHLRRRCWDDFAVVA